MRVPICPHPRQHLSFFTFLTAVLVGLEWYLIVVLIFVSLMASDIGLPLMCLLTIGMSPLENHLLKTQRFHIPQSSQHHRRRGSAMFFCGVFFFVEEETKAERGWAAPYLISDGSKVSLTLKFTPHTRPRQSRAQMLVPSENGSHRSMGCGGGVSTKNGSPHGDLQAGGGRGFHGRLQ